MHSCILTILPVWLWVFGSYQERCTQDWMVPPCAEWWGEMDNRATTPFGYCPSMASLPVSPHCVNARWNRCQDLNSCPLENWKRPPGRPRTTQMKTIQQDLESNNLSLKEATDVVQNRPLWRLMSTFGATHSRWWCMPAMMMMTLRSCHIAITDASTLTIRYDTIQ